MDSLDTKLTVNPMNKDLAAPPPPRGLNLDKHQIDLNNNHPIPEDHQASGQYIKSAVYGGIDGILTTSSLLVSCVLNESALQALVVIALAAIISDGVGMALGDYLSTKSEKEYIVSERKRERWEIENFPEGEKQEMTEIYIGKGINESDAKLMVQTMSKNKDAWVEIMLREELEIVDNDENPLTHAMVTFVSFVIFGLSPLLPQLVEKFNGKTGSSMVIASLGITVIVLFLLGSLKTKITARKWWVSGLEIVIIGVLATSVSFIISYLCFEELGVVKG